MLFISQIFVANKIFLGGKCDKNSLNNLKLCDHLDTRDKLSEYMPLFEVPFFIVCGRLNLFSENRVLVNMVHPWP